MKLDFRATKTDISKHTKSRKHAMSRQTNTGNLFEVTVKGVIREGIPFSFLLKLVLLCKRC